MIQGKIDELTVEAKRGAGGITQTPKERLTEFENRLEGVQKTLDETVELQKVADTEIIKANRNLTNAQSKISEATSEISKADDLLKNEGVQALRDAKEKSDQLGQQSGEIGEISQKARALADEIVEKTEKVMETSKKALGTANTAFDELKQVNEMTKQISDALATNVSRNLNRENEKLKETAKRVTKALEEANIAYEKTLTKFASVNSLAIPVVNVESLKSDIKQIQDEAISTESNFNDAKNKNTELTSTYQDHISLAQVLLERGNLQKMDAIELLKTANYSYTKAKEAVLKGDNILKEANSTYHTLAGFKNQVEKSKEDANKALESVRAIEQQIEKANELNHKAKNSLRDAQNNANEAKKNAQDAQLKYAEQASADAEQIQKKANSTKTEAIQLGGEADNLAIRVAATVDRLDKLETVSRDDEDIAKEAKEKVKDQYLFFF